MALKIAHFAGHALPDRGGLLVLLQAREAIDPGALARIGGRPVRVRLEPPAADVAGLLAAGEVVIIRADGAASTTLGLGPLHPVALGLLGGALDFSFVPAVFEPVGRTLHLGAPVPRAEATAEWLRTALYDLNEEAFLARADLGGHLGAACLRGLKKKWFQPVFIDGFLDSRVVKGGMLVAAAWRLASWLRRNVPEPRVGLVLPPGLGASVANLACVLAGKTPVNFNFTAGRALNEAALRHGEVRAVITGAAMIAKARDFPWPERTIDLKELLTGFPKWSILLRWLAGLVLPAALLRRVIGVPAQGGDREAALLFTSGSSGDPKGVVLTHRNLLGNIAQTDAVLSRVPIGSLLACLPIFHSFGCTVTFWWPMLGGPTAVTYVSPMETAKLIELIEKHQVGLLLNTPTFLRNFLRKAEPAQLRSLRLIVTGAEKLPQDLAAEVEKKFGVPVCEGFGMTEATPVVAVNLVDFRLDPADPAYEGPRRKGSVGRLIPGMSVRIRHPETGAPQSLNQSGMIWLRGVNIFPGYLDDPRRTAQVLEDGWYQTGDVGRVDDDGFLFIEGRLSRFSKLAGEMVPHGVLEEMIVRAFPELGEDFHPVVLGVEDAGKGEALVVLTTLPLDTQTLRARLIEKGAPNLWIPRRIRLVEAIPHFATGKVDLRACRALAEQSLTDPL